MNIYINIFSLVILSVLGFNNDDSSIKKNKLLGKWKFYNTRCINTERFDQKFDRIKITESNIEYYNRNFKDRSLVDSEKINFYNQESNFNCFEIIIENGREYWSYHLDSTGTKLRILGVTKNAEEKELNILNRLNYGYFDKIE